MSQNRYFQTILEHIIDGKCVLMLGPDAATVPGEGISLSSFMPKHFATHTHLKFDDEGLVHFQDLSDKLLFYSDLKAFYQQYNEPDELHKQLARIPFHLTVSTAPHHLLRKAYQDMGINHRFAYFNKSKTVEHGISIPPAANDPVLYNFFGSLSDNDSLIITNDDLFDLLFAVIGKSQLLPEPVLKSIQEAKVFLFLGFNFEQWFLKMLFRFFRMHEAPLPLVPEETFAGTQDAIRSFYVENFQVKMLDGSPQEFMEKIYQAFEQGVEINGEIFGLRKIKEASESDLAKQLRDTVKAGEIEKAFDLLETYEEQIEAFSTPTVEDIAIQASRFNRLQKKFKKGTVSIADKMLEMNRIIDALLNIASGLRDMPTAN